jgi:hypothetical protein
LSVERPEHCDGQGDGNTCRSPKLAAFDARMVHWTISFALRTAPHPITSEI